MNVLYFQILLERMVVGIIGVWLLIEDCVKSLLQKQELKKKNTE
jgi:hypothetical protein